jgi:hypothetical protein
MVRSLHRPTRVPIVRPPVIVIAGVCVQDAQAKFITSGWLLKKGQGTSLVGRHSWKRRWFVIKGQTLFYFTAPTDQTPKVHCARSLHVPSPLLYDVCFPEAVSVHKLGLCDRGGVPHGLYPSCRLLHCFARR